MVTTIRLPDNLHKSIKYLATQRGLSFNAIVIMALMEYVKK